MRAVPYQDNHHIVSAFTKEGGIVRLFVRGTLRSRRASHALCTPLVLAELVMREGKGGLFSLKEGNVVDPHTGLRADYGRLDAAGQMAGALLALLWPGKPAPSLFTLSARYLKAMEGAAHPDALLASFLCKVLKHEGLWVAPLNCAGCEAPLASCAAIRSETLCARCAPVGGVELGEEEREALVRLTESRRFEEIDHPLPETLPQKVSLIFKSSL